MEELSDKTITCVECGTDFVWSVGEQVFFEKRGFHDPRRCHNCKAEEKERKGETTQWRGTANWKPQAERD